MKTLQIIKPFYFAAALFVAALTIFSANLFAQQQQQQIRVSPSNTQGFSTADTRPGGAVNFVFDNTAPAGVGALQLTTNNTNAAKAQFIHGANTSLASVTELSYYTKQVSTSSAAGDPSYQILINLDGTSNTFTTLVYEPYQNGTISPGV